MFRPHEREPAEERNHRARRLPPYLQDYEVSCPMMACEPNDEQTRPLSSPEIMQSVKSMREETDQLRRDVQSLTDIIYSAPALSSQPLSLPRQQEEESATPVPMIQQTPSSGFQSHSPNGITSGKIQVDIVFLWIITERMSTATDGLNPIESVRTGIKVYRQQVEAEEQDLSPAQAQHMETEETEDRGPAEDHLSSASLWECLRLLEAFPLTQGQQELVCNTEAPAPPESAPTDMEQQWQDLLDLMEPQTGDVDMGSLLEQTSGSQVTAPAEQGGPLLEGYLQHRAGSDQELLPLLPSDQLDDPTPDPLHMPPTALSTDPSFLLDEADLEELSGGLEDILGDAHMLEEMRLLDLELEEGFGKELSERLEEQGYLDRELTQRTSRLSISRDRNMEEKEEEDIHTVQPDAEDELDTDSGLSLDSSHSPPSPNSSEASYCSTSSSTSRPSSMELEFTIKEEPLEEEELGAVGGQYYPHHDSKHIFSSTFHSDQKLFDGFPWLEQISHDHTYNQPQEISPKTSKHLKSSPKHEKPYHHPRHLWNRDERRARALRIPFSNELIVSLPVEEFNDLLANYQLNEDQLNLVRDIRRRGKNKIAAQNCRKRKMDTLQGLEKDVTMLKRRKSRLLKDKQEALRTLQELKQHLTSLYQDVFSSLRDDEGRPLDVHEYMLSFESDGNVDVVSRRQRSKKSRSKQKDKK